MKFGFSPVRACACLCVGVRWEEGGWTSAKQKLNRPVVVFSEEEEHVFEVFLLTTTEKVKNAFY